MQCSTLLAAVLLLAVPSLPAQTPQISTLTTSTTLVLVPTLVRSATGEVLPDLHAEDFRLTDNGIVQHVLLDRTAPQPIALVLLLQTGGAAHDQLPNYAGLATLIDTLTAPSPGSRAALITFDSQPEELWTFPPHFDGLAYAVSHPVAGDDGAAILDSIAQALDLLDQQPPNYRRLILLVSQQHDAGSAAAADTILRRLSESNTTLEAMTFSPEKAWLHDQFTKSRHGQAPYKMSPLGPTLLDTFDLGTPLGMALRSLRGNPTATLATLSGGEDLPFTNRSSLERQMLQLTNHIPNRYQISFRPTNLTPGVHTLSVGVSGEVRSPLISARAVYWATTPSPSPAAPAP